jgi:glycosyltransferase involved in cell wall biosynthesis
LRAALNGADAILAVSQAFAEIYRTRGVRNVQAFPNGVVKHDVPAASRTGPLRLGLLGGLGVAKGSDLLKAVLHMKKFDNLEFLVVDSSLDTNETRVVHWGRNRVELIGRVDFSGVAAIYGQLHVVLVPSVCLESFGLVAREALSSGRWVVASDRGAVGEDVQNGVNGFVIDVSTPDDLARTLGMLDADPERFRRPHHVSEVYETPSAHAARTLELYQLIASRHAATGF